MIGDFVSEDQRGGAIGLYYTLAGVGQLIASIVAGYVWNIRLINGHVMLTFAIGTVCALLAIPIILSVPTRPVRAGSNG